MGRRLHLVFCAAVFVFLVAPILVIVPLSFNAEPYFTFTEGMLRLDADAWSLRWYDAVLGDEEWLRALVNSLIIGVAATTLATSLGVLAALGLANASMPGRSLAMGLLISPMVTPVIVSAAGMFFFYSSLGLAQTHLGLVLAHAALGTPFVVITVTATLAGFNHDLTRAAASLGAGPLARLPARAVAAHPPRGAVRRPVRVRDVFRRSGDGAVHGGTRTAHHPTPDVVGRARADQPGDPGGGHLPDCLCAAVHGAGGVAAPTGWRCDGCRRSELTGERWQVEPLQEFREDIA